MTYRLYAYTTTKPKNQYLSTSLTDMKYNKFKKQIFIKKLILKILCMHKFYFINLKRIISVSCEIYL